jgi:hypothetical protein
MTGWAALAGFSFSPDQFLVGGRVDLGEIVPRVRILPSADVGFGDHATVYTFGSSLVYELPVGAGDAYLGGGVALVHSDLDRPDFTDQFGIVHKGDEGGSEVGLLGNAGFRYPMGEGSLLLDGKFGLEDHYADAKILLGYEVRWGRP